MTRNWVALIGIMLLAVVWLGPLPRLVETSFAAHMTLHLILISVAAPLIAIGLAGTRVDAWLAEFGALNAIFASAAELIVVWAWHVPALHSASRGSNIIFGLEQISFLLVGLVLWLSVFSHVGNVARRAAIGVIALLLTSMHMALLGALLNLAPRALYAHHGATLADQQLGGLLMLVVGGTVYLFAGLWLLARLLTESPASRT